MAPNPREVGLDAQNLTIGCHVRAPMLLEPVDSHVETLQVCESEELINEVMLRSWPKEVALAPERPERAVIERFDAFREWADRASVDIQPPFEIRTRKSLATGEETDLLVLPLICLALYDDEGGLVGVYPHSADGETYTVEDAIARLRTGEVPVPLSVTSARVERGETCPDCNGLLVNGQGLYACPDCAWVGAVGAEGKFEPLAPIRAGGAVEVSVAPGASEETDPGAEPDTKSSTGSDDDNGPLMPNN